MPEFYPSQIYNPDPKVKHTPTFSILSEQKGFGLDEAKQKIAQGIKYLFILVNGQQLPVMEENDARDQIFGRKLTGIHRIQQHGVWKWEYQIYTQESPFPNAAAHLFHTYQEKALIIDVLNAKFDWEDPESDNQQSLHYMITLIQELYQTAQTANQSLPACFLAGYSRGGIFTLRLAEALKNIAEIKAVVTIDPVIAPWKDDDLVIGWGVKKGESWSIRWKKKLSGAHLYGDVFPILRNPGLRCYNIFQRRSFFTLNNLLEKPVGSAIENAKAPNAKKWNVKSVSPEIHCQQYDESMNSHSEMVEKYACWVVEIAHLVCPV